MKVMTIKIIINLFLLIALGLTINQRCTFNSSCPINAYCQSNGYCACSPNYIGSCSTYASALTSNAINSLVNSNSYTYYEISPNSLNTYI